jgi:hypothetical protein
MLLAANLVPILGVLVWKWSVFPILALLWLETVMLGAVQFLRMLFAYPGNWVVGVLKLILLPFILLYLGMYGMVVLLVAVFVFGTFGPPEVAHAFWSVLWSASDAKGLLPVPDALQVLRSQVDTWMMVSIAALVASHLYSFFWNYLYRGECRRISLAAMLIWPIARLGLVWLAIGAGALGLLRLDFVEAPAWMVIVLIGVKTALDLHAHLREHKA